MQKVLWGGSWPVSVLYFEFHAIRASAIRTPCQWVLVCDVCLYCVVVRELTLACMFSVLQMPPRRRPRPTAQVVVDYLEGEWGLCPDGRMSFIGHVRVTKYVRGQRVREWDEEWAEWSTPAEDHHLGVSAATAKVPEGPATTVAGGPLVGPG